MLVHLFFLIFNCLICWNENIKLKWSDFKGIPDNKTVTTTKTSAEARTAVELVIIPGIDDKGFPNYSVSNCFIREESWTKDSLSSELLQHEQLHFDISELYARKIRKGINNLITSRERERDKYEELIDRYLEEKDETQLRYDVETANGGVDFVQKEWNGMVKSELAKLKSFSIMPSECSCGATPAGAGF